LKLSLRLTLYFAAVMALACFGWAAAGFIALREIADPALASDTQGYSWFWAFLGFVACAVAAASWWLARDPPIRP